MIAFPGDAIAVAVAAVEFKDRFGGFIGKVAVAGDADHGAREANEELLEPVERFSVE